MREPYTDHGTGMSNSPSKDRHTLLGRTVSALVTLLLVAAPVEAQSTLTRTPNLGAAWVAPHGALQFNFLHRFFVTDAPRRKVVSAPTFILAAGAPGHTNLGLKYATNSEVEPRLPNEWTAFGRYRWEGGATSAGLEVEYSFAGESVDGEATLARRLGPLRLLAVARAFTNPPAGMTAVGFAGGAVLTLRRWLALAGDYGGWGQDNTTWGAGVQLAIPTTPHTLSLHATNTNSASIRGSAAATGQVRYGFEFTIPVTPARYIGGAGAAPAPVAGAAGARPEPGEPGAPGVAVSDSPTVVIPIQGLAFTADTVRIRVGEVVEWVNRDPVVHTATADDGSFDSGDIAPGESWRYRFDRAGEFPYHCTPHPFMQAVIIVEARP